MINFQRGVEPVSFRHDLLHLVGDNRIEAAAEGIEFHQFQIGMAGDIVGGAVETAVPGPLVQYAERGNLLPCIMAMPSSERTAIPSWLIRSGMLWLIAGSAW